MTEARAYNGGRKPRNFGINQANQGSNGGVYIKPIARLVEVEKYDLAAQQIYCKDVKDGRKMVVHVNEEQKARDMEYARNNPPETPYVGMVGYMVDKYMEDEYPAGSRLLLKRTKVLKKDRGDGYSVVETSNVRGVPNPEEDKTFYGLFGGSLRHDEDGNVCVARVSIWDRIYKNGLNYTNDAEIERMAGVIEERNKNSSRRLTDKIRETMPVIGVQFRALVPSGKQDADGKEIMTLKSLSDLFHWIDGPEDADGKIIREQSHPLTGQEFLDYFDGYAEWVAGNEYFLKLKEQGVQVELEAVFYESAPGSNNKNLRIGHRNDDKTKEKQMYKLCTTTNYLDLEKTTLQYHDNMVVSGIIQMSANKYEKIKDGKIDKVGGTLTEVRSYWVNNLHIDGITGHVHAFVRDSQGRKVEVDPALKLIYANGPKSADDRAETYDAAPAPSQAQAASTVTQEQTSSAEPVQDSASDDQDPFDFFDNDTTIKSAQETSSSSGTEGRRSRFGRSNS